MLEKDNITITICGAAGQGIQTVEGIVTRVLKKAGYNIYATKEVMSRVRGGTNSTQIRVSSKPVSALKKTIDVLIPISPEAIPHMRKRFNITDETLFIGDPSIVKALRDEQKMEVPFMELAIEIGGKIYANVIGAGVICGLFDVDFQIIKDYLTERFSAKGEEILQNNFKAAEKGVELGKSLLDSKKISISIQKDENVKNQILLDGSAAVGLGAIAGGCNFMYSYPMSPSTGVLTFLAGNSKEFGIVVEQAEDEVGALHGVMGAWYVGGRGMATTSGGGFALMSEALSLVGVGESPVVIHLAQRPGPATGLPTRTIQSDLQLILYAGHGFFPRIILTPASVDDAFYLAQKAFNLAAKYQVPVFILTDEYLVDTYYNVPIFDLSQLKIEEHVIKTGKDYKRYELTENGISPRGIPRNGDSLIAFDSHTHDEYGHISEDLEGMRLKMVDKRKKKLETITKDCVPPKLTGKRECKLMVISWGSTYHMVKDAIEIINIDDISHLHYSQVFPLHPNTEELICEADKIVIVEGNIEGQFANLIQHETGRVIKNRILKYNGMAFFTEE